MRLADKAKERNYKNNYKGDLKQNGGDIIIRKDGTLIKLFIQKDPSESLQLDDLKLSLQLAAKNDQNFSSEDVPLESQKYRKK